MARRYLIVLILLISTIVNLQAQAASNTVPIIAFSKGDFWAINPDDGSVTQITHHKQDLDFFQPYSQTDLALSPDGQYVAYLKTPVFFAIAMRNGLFGDLGEYPTDVVLLNLKTAEEKVIAVQQSNVKYSDWERLWYRSNLIWSPDSSQLAYYQRRGTVAADFQSEALIYNRLTGNTVKLKPVQSSNTDIAWLDNGIGAGSTLYDTNGKVIKQNPVNTWVQLGHWLTYQGETYKVVDPLVFKPPTGQTYLMNALTGQFSVVEGYEASTSAANPENSLMFFGDVNNYSIAYVFDPQTGNRFEPPKDPYATNFIFSPDGKLFAYIVASKINISDLKGKDRTVDFEASAIVWGSKQYTVASESGEQRALPVATTDLDADPFCGTLPSVGLVAGGQGRVRMGGTSNRVRLDPYIASDVIALMPVGTVFKVVDGMQEVCNDGIRWVQVEYNEMVGWTAEGANGEVFLEPVQ